MKSPNRKTKNKPESSLTPALNFFAEAGLLKKVKRSGWWVAGIRDPESVAEHCFRCAIMAHYIAHLEKVNTYKAVTMALFNDIHESRINDLHKMGHFYIDFKQAEQRVFADQIRQLDGLVKAELEAFRREYDSQTSPESHVARDADILECLVQAKEYHQAGYVGAKKFLTLAPQFLKTPTAKTLWRALKKWDASHWWQKVVKFER